MDLFEDEPIQAVSFDFYQTLAFHRLGCGRGAALMQYFRSVGLDSSPWEHVVLYDIFDRHAEEYRPEAYEWEEKAYRKRIAARLFDRMSIKGEDPAGHVEALWKILGPSSLDLFPETLEVLTRISTSGLPIVIISNWQSGLRHFCAELGIARFFVEIFVSAEEGFQKPDPRIFERACRVLGMNKRNVLHVGDSRVDDYEGGLTSGLKVALIDREGPDHEPDVPTIRSLRDLLPMLGLD